MLLLDLTVVTLAVAFLAVVGALVLVLRAQASERARLVSLIVARHAADAASLLRSSEAPKRRKRHAEPETADPEAAHPIGL